MAEEGATINNGGAPSTPQAPAAREELISTVDRLSPTMNADTSSKGDDKAGAEGGDTAKTKTPDEEGELTRFDKHPRFVELNTRLKAAEDSNRQLQASLAELKVQSAKAAETKPAEVVLPYKDLSKMSDDEILDWQSSDPKGYAQNLINMQEYAAEQRFQKLEKERTGKSEQETFEKSVSRTYEAYAKENADFDQMWDSGEIKKYMDDHPGHNAISAHMALTSEKRIQEKTDAAVKEALKKAEAAQRSKRAAGVILGPGPSSIPAGGSDVELKNPKQYGGATSVLAARLAARRRAASGG